VGLNSSFRLRKKLSAVEIANDSSIRWHQKFQIGETGVITPGVNDLEYLFDMAQIPKDLRGASVLDIGTTNGGSAFLSEQRGAKRIIAVDICGPETFGFDKISYHLNSNVKFVQSSVYELPTRLKKEKFDIVFFWGVLYHLRHPLLSFDILNQITQNFLTIETVVSSSEDTSADFFRNDELSNDGSNWWAPSEKCLLQFCESSGFSAKVMNRWDARVSDRILVNAQKKNMIPEYLTLGYEREIEGVRFSSRLPTRQA